MPPSPAEPAHLHPHERCAPLKSHRAAARRARRRFPADEGAVRLDNGNLTLSEREAQLFDSAAPQPLFRGDSLGGNRLSPELRERESDTASPWRTFGCRPHGRLLFAGFPSSQAPKKPTAIQRVHPSLLNRCRRAVSWRGAETAQKIAVRQAPDCDRSIVAAGRDPLGGGMNCHGINPVLRPFETP